jgi:hypothetical protein
LRICNEMFSNQARNRRDTCELVLREQVKR